MIFVTKIKFEQKHNTQRKERHRHHHALGNERTNERANAPTLGMCQKYTKSSGLLNSVPASSESRKYSGIMSLSTGGYKPPMKFFTCLSLVSSSIMSNVSTFCSMRPLPPRGSAVAVVA